MSDISWMESVAYQHAESMEEMLNKAYKQGASDAWCNVKHLMENGVLISLDWSADEMMIQGERDEKYRIDVKKLADEMGIHTLYAIVRDMRGEPNE